jgi:chromosome segregation ATPase
MRDNSVRKLVITVFAILLIGGLLVDSAAQKRRRTRRRTSAPKITNPEIYQPSPGDNSNSNSSETSTTNGNSNSSPTEDPESMKRTIRTLSNQVDRLTDKLNDLQASQQSMVDLERLSRSEQRSAQLRTELSGVQAKKSELAGHLEDVEYALKPENIERAATGIGTTRPEEVREQRRKQLESDRTRTQQQLDQLNTNEARLQQAIATSDADVDRLQKKLDAADRAAIENAKTNSQSGASQVAASPTPTP